MSVYRDLTNKVTVDTLDYKVAVIETAVNNKIIEVNEAIAAIPDVNVIAQEQAIAMAVALG